MAPDTIVQLLTAGGAAGAGAIVLRLIDYVSARRSSVASVENTYSADARAWADTFRAELEAQSARHAREMESLAARLSAMETRLAASEQSRAALVAENAKLELEVSRLTARVAELERTAPENK